MVFWSINNDLEVDRNLLQVCNSNVSHELYVISYGNAFYCSCYLFFLLFFVIMQVKNWFQNRRMKWKRQCGSMSNQVSSSEHHPTTAHLQAQHGAIHHHQQQSSKETENQQHYISSVAVTSCPAPPVHASTAQCTDSSSTAVTQRMAPNELVSSTGTVAHTSVPPHHSMMLPRGYAFPMPFAPVGAGYGFQQMYMPEPHSAREEKDSTKQT